MLYEGSNFADGKEKSHACKESFFYSAFNVNQIWIHLATIDRTVFMQNGDYKAQMGKRIEMQMYEKHRPANSLVALTNQDTYGEPSGVNFFP